MAAKQADRVTLGIGDIMPAANAQASRAGEFEEACPLILLPGTLCDARLFDALLDCLPPRETIVMPMAGAHSAPAMARKLLACAPVRFALLGFSLGGIVALEMAAIAPERIAGLALVATNARADPATNAPGRRAATRERPRVHAERLWDRSVAPVHRARNDLRALVLAMADSTTADAFSAQTEIAITRADSRPRLGRLTTPTLALCGAGDLICPPALHQEIVQAVPHATLAVVPDAGHFVLIEAPQAAASLVATWLDRISMAAGLPAHDKESS